MPDPGRPGRSTRGQLDVALTAVADFADITSLFLRGHSRGVAALEVIRQFTAN